MLVNLLSTTTKCLTQTIYLHRSFSSASPPWWGRQSRMDSSRQGCLCKSGLSPFPVFTSPGLWDGATRTQWASPLGNPYWKHSQRHTQRGPTSDPTKLTTKIHYHRENAGPTQSIEGFFQKAGKSALRYRPENTLKTTEVLWKRHVTVCLKI